MLTYQISKPSETHERKLFQQLNNLILLDAARQEKILRVHLEKFPRFKAGDRVRFKKPKRNPIEGTIIAVEHDVDKVEWVQAMPLFLTVQLDAKFVVGGKHTVKTAGKKLYYIGQT